MGMTQAIIDSMYRELASLQAELEGIAARNVNTVNSPAVGSKPDAAGPYSVGHMAYVQQLTDKRDKLIKTITEAEAKLQEQTDGTGTVRVHYGIPG